MKKLDLFKSFSEFLNVYERYDNQLVCNLITYVIPFYTVYFVIPFHTDFLLFILKQQSFSLQEDLECSTKLLNLEDSVLKWHPRPHHFNINLLFSFFTSNLRYTQQIFFIMIQSNLLDNTEGTPILFILILRII